MLSVKEEDVLNLVCAYEGPRFTLTRIQIKFPSAVYADRQRDEVPHGRIMIFVLDSCVHQQKEKQEVIERERERE
jgi:hypothetical protein